MHTTSPDIGATSGMALITVPMRQWERDHPLVQPHSASILREDVLPGLKLAVTAAPRHVGPSRDNLTIMLPGEALAFLENWYDN